MRNLTTLLLLVMVLLIAGAGCIDTSGQVKAGDTIRVHYTGSFDNKTVFDSSAEREPLEFTVGAGEMIKGFDEGVIGMQVGETKTIHIPADRAYGNYREDLIFLVDPASISGGTSPAGGEQICITLPNGQVLVGTVTDVSPDGVIIDANHHLAGEDLTFSISLVEIE